MFQAVMIIKGSVRLSDHSSDKDHVYQDGVRPSAKSIDGFAICEVKLDKVGSLIALNPQQADLNFYRVVSFKDNAEEIELYDGANLVMLFVPHSKK